MMEEKKCKMKIRKIGNKLNIQMNGYCDMDNIKLVNINKEVELPDFEREI